MDIKRIAFDVEELAERMKRHTVRNVGRWDGRRRGQSASSRIPHIQPRSGIEANGHNPHFLCKVVSAGSNLTWVCLHTGEDYANQKGGDRKDALRLTGHAPRLRRAHVLDD